MSDQPFPSQSGRPRGASAGAREAVVSAVRERPGISLQELAEAIRDRTGAPIASAITAIRALERDGTLARGADDGYNLTARAAEEATGAEEAAPVESDQRAGAARVVRPVSPVFSEAAAPADEPEKSTFAGDIKPDAVPAPPPDAPAAPPPPSDAFVRRIGARDEAAFAGYRAARDAPVHAYCSRICAVEAIPAAVEASFHACRETVLAEAPASDADLDQLLLRTTRHEAAERAAPIRPPRQSGFLGASGLRSVVGDRGRTAACEVMPKLLAARASGRLSPADVERVSRHLSRCHDCRLLENRFREAEHVFHQRLADSPLPFVDDIPPAPAAPPIGSPLPGVSTSDPAVGREPERPAPTPEPATSEGTEPAAAPAEAPGPAPAEAAHSARAAQGGTEPTGVRLLGGAAAPATPPPLVEGAPPTRRGLVALVLVALAATLAVAGYLLLRGGEGETTAPVPSPPPQETGPAEPLFDTSSVEVTVLSGAEDPKAAARAAKLLEKAGFGVREDGEAAAPVSRTTVLFQGKDPESRRAALAVKRKLGARTIVMERLDGANAEIVGDRAEVAVVAGPDVGPGSDVPEQGERGR